jgi:hypothetical protein
MTTAQELLTRHGINLESYAPGRYYTTCPKCSHTRSTPNQKLKVLGITIGDDGSVCWGCNHCTYSGPEKGSGERRELTSYVYRDADGTPRFRKVRNAPGREPRFWLERADGRGGWMKGTKDVNTKIIYRADEVTKAIADGRIIACAEGEKDCDGLWAIGIPAVCNAHGASEPGKRAKWTKAHSEQLAGADLVVFNDNDAAGYEHADVTCKLSIGVAKRVRRLDLKPHWPDIPKGGDISDWLALGHGREELDKLIAAAPDYQPQAGEQASQESSAAGGAGIDDAAEIEKLARLAPLDYERARKDAGKRLGISRLSLLDGLVKAKRTELGLDGGDAGQGRPIEFAEVEPSPEPVNGAELLDDLARTFRNHVVMPDHARDACALWAVHTYLIRLFAVSPKLSINSPVKGCGKSTLLEVLNYLVYRALLTGSISPAALFRVIESHHPTLLIDEVDTFVGDDLDLKGMLNQSHRHDGHVTRTVGESFEPRRFGVYAATALAGIGRLADTLADRSLPIDLQRRLPGEEIKQLRVGRTGHLDELRRRISRWVADNGERIAACEPVMPPTIVNRQADNWFALFAVADVAGGDWPGRARSAALKMTAASDEGSRLELLLGDIRGIFAERKVEQISSEALVERLVAIEGRPWAEFGRNDKPLTTNQLARLLRDTGRSGVAPERITITVWDERAEQHVEKQVRGYLLARFQDAFARYLPPEGDAQPSNRQKRDEMGTSEISQPSRPAKPLTVAKCEKFNNDGLFDTLTVAKGGNGKAHTARAAEACAPRGPDSPEPCAYCGRPGGNAVAFGEGGSIRLHRECEQPWIENRMAEEGIWRA